MITVALSFAILSPLVTFGLLVTKGLPSFAAGHVGEVFLWVYQVTWIPALLSGGLLSGILRGIRSRTPFFVKPYDFGRCFSLGAVSGALVQAVSTWSYRLVSHRPFSSFWIAGAMISGSIAAAIIVPICMSKLSKK